MDDVLQLLERARYCLEHGWFTAAYDALARAQQITNTLEALA